MRQRHLRGRGRARTRSRLGIDEGLRRAHDSPGGVVRPSPSSTGRLPLVIPLLGSGRAESNTLFSRLSEAINADWQPAQGSRPGVSRPGGREQTSWTSYAGTANDRVPCTSRDVSQPRLVGSDLSRILPTAPRRLRQVYAHPTQMEPHGRIPDPRDEHTRSRRGDRVPI